MLSVRNLTIGFAGRSGLLTAVDGISFDIAAGETFAIIGESGSGKTLTGMSVVGLQPETAICSGSITFKGRELLNRPEAELRSVRGRDIGIVYQDPLGALNPVWPIGDQIAEGLQVHGLADRRSAESRAIELLERVHIPDPARVAKAYPHEISGGMRQRAVFAMALACGPKLLIADEPTTALDVTIKAQILELMQELQEEFALTVMLITHDMGVVAEVADHIMVMYAGAIAEIGPADEILAAPSHPYTSVLLASAMISEAAPQTPLTMAPGGAPPLGELPAGCRFHQRCPQAAEICLTQAPWLGARGPVRFACHHPMGEVVPFRPVAAGGGT